MTDFRRYMRIQDVIAEIPGTRRLEPADIDRLVPGASLVVPAQPGAPGGALVRQTTDASQFVQSAATVEDVVKAIDQAGGVARAGDLVSTLAASGLAATAHAISAAESQGRIKWRQDFWWAI